MKEFPFPYMIKKLGIKRTDSSRSAYCKKHHPAKPDMSCSVCRKIEEERIAEAEKALHDLKKDPDVIIAGEVN